MDYRRIFNAKTGVVAGVALAPVVTGLLVATDHELSKSPLEAIAALAVILPPLCACVGAAMNYAAGHFFNLGNKVDSIALGDNGNYQD